jgi:hypothetical protein
MRHSFPKDDIPPPTGNTIPSVYLIIKEDKHDWFLQILFRFLEVTIGMLKWKENTPFRRK